MNIAIKYKDRIDTSLILPQVNWRKPRNDRRLALTAAAAESLPEAQFAHEAQAATAVGKKK
jgi:hypothetical protein